MKQRDSSGERGRSKSPGKHRQSRNASSHRETSEHHRGEADTVEHESSEASPDGGGGGRDRSTSRAESEEAIEELTSRELLALICSENKRKDKVIQDCMKVLRLRSDASVTLSIPKLTIQNVFSRHLNQ